MPMWRDVVSGMKSPAAETKTRKGVLLQIALYVLAGVMLFYSVMLVFTSNFNMGNLIVWVLTVACCVYAVSYTHLPLPPMPC